MRRSTVLSLPFHLVLLALAYLASMSETSIFYIKFPPEFAHPPAVVDAVGLALQDFDDVALLKGDFVAAGGVVVVQRAAEVGHAASDAADF
jgi:hypothetical protein